jgi:sulfonate transport system ATP-binding protein
VTRLLKNQIPASRSAQPAAQAEPGSADSIRAPSATDDQRGTEIELIGVSKTFGTKPILREIDLRVRVDEFLAVVGRSGCGKSTLLRIMAGLERPTSGKTLVNQRPIDGLNRGARMMFQDARLLPWLRVGENVAVGHGGPVDEAVRAALHRVDLANRIEEWPAILSGGQRQRVALARALIGNPRLLLLDEPLGALDALTRMEMQTLIHDLWQASACTAILVTHDIEEAVLLSDRVLFIDEGRIQAEFPVDLPRPRDRTAAEFQDLVRRVLDCVLVRNHRDLQ